MYFRDEMIIVVNDKDSEVGELPKKGGGGKQAQRRIYLKSLVTTVHLNKLENTWMFSVCVLIEVYPNMELLIDTTFHLIM